VKTITRDFNRPRVQVPPGEILLEEFLRPGGLTQVEAARRMKVPLNRLNEIVRGRRAITADTALRLAALEAAASGQAVPAWPARRVALRRHRALAGTVAGAFALVVIAAVLFGLEKAYEQRDPNMPYLSCWPLCDPLRSDPRFQALMRRIGLPQ